MIYCYIHIVFIRKLTVISLKWYLCTFIVNKKRAYNFKHAAKIE